MMEMRWVEYKDGGNLELQTRVWRPKRAQLPNVQVPDLSAFYEWGWSEWETVPIVEKYRETDNQPRQIQDIPKDQNKN